MGSASFDLNGNNTRCTGTVSWTKNANSVSFTYSFLGYCNAKSSKFVGNNDGSVHVTVDGTRIGGNSNYKYAGAKTAGQGASGSGWIAESNYARNNLGPLELSAKTGTYEIKFICTGNFSDHSTKYTESFTWTIPVYINDDGTVKELDKVYVNAGGVIKECTVYLNVGGTIKEIS